MYYERKISIYKISKDLGISRMTLYRWVKQISINKNPTREKGYRSILKNFTNPIIDFINCKNISSLKEVEIFINEKFNFKVSISTIHRFLVFNNFTYKKGTRYYTEADTVLQEKFKKEIKTFENLFAIDESSFHLNENRRYGRSLKGTKAIIKCNGNRGLTFSLLLSISTNKIDYQLTKGSFNAKMFRSFLECNISNNVNLILDNARIHHASAVLTQNNLKTIKETAKSKNINLMYLPPYSPYMNPVEYCFNIIKSYVRSKSPKTITTLEICVKDGIKKINNPKILKNIFKKIF